MGVVVHVTIYFFFFLSSSNLNEMYSVLTNKYLESIVSLALTIQTQYIFFIT